MGGYEKIITDEKGNKYLKKSDLQMVIPLPKKLTKKGEKLADEIAQEAADALVRRMLGGK